MIDPPDHFNPRHSFVCTIDDHLLPPATKLGQGNIFRSVCQEFCSQGGWYPSIQCRSPGSHPEGKLRGLAWGEVEGSGLGGLQAHTQEGLQAHTRWGGGVSQHALRQTPPYWNAFLFISDSIRLSISNFTSLGIDHQVA